METSNKAVALILNNLMNRCKESLHGFQTLAEASKDKETTDILNKYASQRQDFIKELQQEILIFAENDETLGNISSSDQSSWIQIQKVVAEPSRENIIELCRDEEINLSLEYSNSIKQELPGNTKGLVTKQYNLVRNARDEFKLLYERLNIR
jgi:uncharacterized protein (TIGR02284 family)